jgi:hypothetical protein
MRFLSHLVAFMVLGTLSTFTAAHAQNASLPRSAHRYILSGCDLHITYLSTGPDGRPRLQYQDGVQVLHFTGDQIRLVTLDIGTLVTVTIRLTVDTGSTSFTLVLPQVNLGPLNEAQIKTFGVTTVHRFSVVPELNRGQTELYTVTELSGTEAVVPF